MTEPSVAQATDTQIRTLARAIQSHAAFIARQVTMTDLDVDRQLVQTHVALLASDVDRLSRLVQPLAPDLEVTLTADQRTLLLEYARVDEGTLAAAGLSMPLAIRHQARLELVRQDLVRASWTPAERLTDLGRQIVRDLRFEGGESIS